MQRSRWLLPLLIISLIVVMMITGVIIMIFNGLGFSTGRYLEANNGAAMMIVENSPTVMSNRTNRDIFKNLDTGDKILVIHGATAESYPGRTGVYAIFKIGNGTLDDIPSTVIESLIDLGWFKK